MPAVDVPNPLTTALEAAFERYVEAQQGADRQERLIARLGLCLALIDTGWEPPAAVRDQMDRDERALRRLRHAEVVDLRDVLDLTGWRSRAPDTEVTAAGRAAATTAGRRPRRRPPPT